ncbi:CrcB family protein [Nesterenkonia sp. HG001]|uniref:fluoride efflux transporter FluC n=1 Tax=Nesterenkonia sp. HG001 TaxID=2983207 RepID=UPI002AC37AB3|nr:CrcB family protein [Nesterenkonia sp. HG001]MDZ5076031.1 CrcB family protein [Nesterenkonia sp. HG001]
MTTTLSVAVVLGVALGGATGAVLRLLLDRYVRYGILVANSLGCLFLGFLFGRFSALTALEAVPESGVFSPGVITVVSYGLIGALSTFATVSLRAAQRWVDGHRMQAAWIWLVNVACGFLAAGIGLALSGLAAL